MRSENILFLSRKKKYTIHENKAKMLRPKLKHIFRLQNFKLQKASTGTVTLNCFVFSCFLFYLFFFFSGKWILFLVTILVYIALDY